MAADYGTPTQLAARPAYPSQPLNAPCAFSMVSAMFTVHTTLQRLTLATLALSLVACGNPSTPATTGTDGGGAGPGVVPGDPGWEPVTPPDESICVGATPGPEAWALSRAIAEAAAEAAAAAAAEPDTVAPDDATDEADVVLPPDFQFPPLPDPEPEDPEDDVVTDPCSPDYEDPEDCMGAEAPAFAAYDFQPQSCGFGATYGLDVFKGRVTFVALFASW
jgi:hypothetical protein